MKIARGILKKFRFFLKKLVKKGKSGEKGLGKSSFYSSFF